MQKLLLLKSNPKRCVTYFLLLLTFSFPTNALASIIQIDDKDQLLRIGESGGLPLSGDYELTSSIILDPASSATYISEIFSGTFDGKGHTISGLTRPLFNDIGGNSFEDKAIVKDLVLETSGGGVLGRGILANDANSYVLIENVGTKGIIVGSAEDSVGGIVGSLTVGFETSGLITKSFSTASVYGDDKVGGLVGEVGSNGEITESYSNGSVTGDQYIGGIVGITYGNISNSYATGEVSGDSYVGGFIGSLFNNREIINSYASGSVLGTNNRIGGFAGELWYGEILNSYASGDVNGQQNVGGFVGISQQALLRHSYATGDISGVGPSIGRFYGQVSSSTFTEVLGTGLLTNLTPSEDEAPSSSYSGTPAPSKLEVVNQRSTTTISPGTEFETVIELSPGSKFGQDSCLNNGNPYLVSMRNSFQSSCIVEGGRSSVRVNRSITLQKESLTSVSNTSGFSPKNLDLGTLKILSFDSVFNEGNTLVSSIKTEVNKTSQIFISSGEGLQISLKSPGKEKLQLWVRLADGSTALFGMVTFDENGNATLPAIEFNIVGQYEFIFINEADKLPDNLELKNQLGSLVINVE